MKKLIHSVFSDDNYNLDGYYMVEVPDEFPLEYRDIIECTGEILDEIQSADGCFDMSDLQDWIDHTGKPMGSYVFGLFKDNFEKAKRLGEGDAYGSDLSRTLEFLGWKYEILKADSYDADYDSFD